MLASGLYMAFACARRGGEAQNKSKLVPIVYENVHQNMEELTDFSVLFSKIKHKYSLVCTIKTMVLREVPLLLGYVFPKVHPVMSINESTGEGEPHLPEERMNITAVL